MTPRTPTSTPGQRKKPTDLRISVYPHLEIDSPHPKIDSDHPIFPAGVPEIDSGLGISVYRFRIFGYPHLIPDSGRIVPHSRQLIPDSPRPKPNSGHLKTNSPHPQGTAILRIARQ